MGLRDRLASPWLAASLLAALLALAGAAALATGLVTVPPLDLSFFTIETPRPSTDAPTPSPSPLPTSLIEGTFARPTPSPAPTFVTYEVHVGDSLTSIAAKFHSSARSIAWWNRGTYPSLDPESPGYAPNRIELGWVLTILPGAVVDENNPPTPSPAPETLPPPSPLSS